MSHLEPARILTLGLEPETCPTGEETAHLRRCACCAEALDAERELSRALRLLALPEAPAGLVSATAARYAETMAARRRRTRWTLAVSLAAGIALAAAVVLLAAMSFRPLMMGAVAWVKHAAVIATMGRSLVVSVPAVAPATAVACGATAAFTAWALSRLARGALPMPK